DADDVAGLRADRARHGVARIDLGELVGGGAVLVEDGARFIVREDLVARDEIVLHHVECLGHGYHSLNMEETRAPFAGRRLISTAGSRGGRRASLATRFPFCILSPLLSLGARRRGIAGDGPAAGGPQRAWRDSNPRPSG